MLRHLSTVEGGAVGSGHVLSGTALPRRRRRDLRDRAARDGRAGPRAAGRRRPLPPPGASTGGDFGLYRWEMTGPPSGPEPHFHRTITESFYVLSGTVRLYDGREWVDATPGEYHFVPPGGIHAFRNESGAPAS